MNNQEQLLHFVHDAYCLLNSLGSIVFIKDLESAFVGCSAGFESMTKMRRENIIGHFDQHFPWASLADLYQQQDKEVLIKNKSEVFEPMPIDNNTILTLRTVKSPIQNATGEIIGILGEMYILAEDKSIGSVLPAIAIKDKKNLALSGLDSRVYQISHYNPALKFTPRESECLFLLLRGKSAKEIAGFLELSCRTVEGYIEHIKNKMGVSSRSEVIAKAIEMNMLEIVPRGNLLLSLYKNYKKWEEFL